MNAGRLPAALTAPLDIHWLALDTAGSADTLAAQVSDDERARAARFARPVLRQRYLAAHAWLRTHLAARAGQTPLALAFDVGPFGKPALRGAGGCAFNLSHSDDLAVIATAASGEIGVDVEVLAPMADAAALAAHHFTRDERAALAAAPPAGRTAAFLLGWTRKEACMKAAGCGLQVEPHDLATGLVTEPRDVTFDAPQGRVTVRVVSWVDAPRMVVSWGWVTG